MCEVIMNRFCFSSVMICAYLRYGCITIHMVSVVVTVWQWRMCMKICG